MPLPAPAQISRKTQRDRSTSRPRPRGLQYWASDRISETTLPTTRRVVECIDARLRVTWASATKTLSDCTGKTPVIATDPYFTSAEYTAHGVPQRWQLGNGLYEGWG